MSGPNRVKLRFIVTGYIHSLIFKHTVFSFEKYPGFPFEKAGQPDPNRGSDSSKIGLR